MNEFYIKDMNRKGIKLIELDQSIQKLGERNLIRGLKLKKVLDQDSGVNK